MKLDMLGECNFQSNHDSSPAHNTTVCCDVVSLSDQESKLTLFLDVIMFGGHVSDADYSGCSRMQLAQWVLVHQLILQDSLG